MRQRARMNSTSTPAQVVVSEVRICSTALPCSNRVICRAGPYFVDGDGLLGVGDRDRRAAGVGDCGDDRQPGRDGQRGTSVGDPVRALGTAGVERLWIGSAPIEAEQDRRLLTDDLP